MTVVVVCRSTVRLPYRSKLRPRAYGSFDRIDMKTSYLVFVSCPAEPSSAHKQDDTSRRRTNRSRAQAATLSSPTKQLRRAADLLQRYACPIQVEGMPEPDVENIQQGTSRWEPLLSRQAFKGGKVSTPAAAAAGAIIEGVRSEQG
jgi:hypothetical protein